MATVSESQELQSAPVQIKIRKRPTDTKRLKQQRRAEEAGKSLVEPTPSNVTLQVVQNGCLGMGKCLYLGTSGTSYLFNCPESLQRLIGEHRLKLAKLDHVFLTQSSWAHSGGLPGLSLALERSGAENLYIHGPRNVAKLFEAVRVYGAKICDVDIHECPYTNRTFEDHAISVSYIPLFKQGEDRAVSVSYLCALKPQPGKVNIEKCKTLGVPMGPGIKTLKEGKPLILDDGREIKPEEVLDQPEAPPQFLILDCPSRDCIDAMLANEALLGIKKNQLTLVIHLSESEAMIDSKYQDWMVNLGSQTKHLLLNQNDLIVAHSEAVANFQIQLNEVSPKFFPLLYCQEEMPEPLLDELPELDWILAKPLMRIPLRPFRKILSTEKNATGEAKTAKMDETEMELKRFPSLDRAMSLDKFPEIFFLGTSSAVPGKYRNMSGIGLNLETNSTILLDCGEGSYQQLFHMFGPIVSDQFLMSLRLIFISHLHMDHHFGVYTIINQRRAAFRRRYEGIRKNQQPEAKSQTFEEFSESNAPICHFIAPSQLFKVHEGYEELVEDFGSHYRMKKTIIDEENSGKCLQRIGGELNMSQLEVVPVDHRLSPFGIVLRTHSGQKIVYSGDTRPCPALIDKGKNADLLIHEATFDNSMQKDAEQKKHSTIAEAVQVGKEMNAKLTVLTHFSGRYPKMPPKTKELLQDGVAVAFDNMRFSLCDGEELSNLIPKLSDAIGPQTLDDVPSE